eukprot:3419221-Amphidinium_carterae.1
MCYAREDARLSGRESDELDNLDRELPRLRRAVLRGQGGPRQSDGLPLRRLADLGRFSGLALRVLGPHRLTTIAS